MPPKAAITEAAVEDIAAIQLYLADGLASPQAAESFMDDLLGIVDNLGATPELYPLSQEPRLAYLGYRKALAGNYVVLYRLVGDTPAIARAFHGSQDYAPLV